MLLSIDTIHDNPDNARSVESSFEHDALLSDSLRTIGLLQPVLVKPHPEIEGEWMLMVGSRRVRCARRLGWTDITAIELPPPDKGFETPPEMAISAAENMARHSMHPVDQWRAIRHLQDKSGYSLETAAAAIGVAKPLAQRMSVLAHLDPLILAEISKQPELPSSQSLRTIAAAPDELQRKGLSSASRDHNGELRWHEIASVCTIKRIPMGRAIFDPKLIEWDQDFFAQPDDEDRFTTTDVEAFMGAQQAALAAQIERSKGRYVMSEEDKMGTYRVKLPRGWTQEYGPVPKRFAKDDPRKVYAAIVMEGYRIGCVDYVVASPRSEAAPGGDLLDDADDNRPKPPVNQATLTRLAEMKASAVRARLLQFKGNGAIDMLRVMLMLFTMKNVSAGKLTGSPHNSLAQALVLADGDPRDDVGEEDLCDMAAWVVREAIAFDHPKNMNGPGKGAEWLALAIGAEMPRTDTKEILRGVSAAKLQEIAREQGVNTKRSPGDLRKAMVGMMPLWRLVDFSAPGPLPPPDRDDDAAEAAE